MNTNLTELIVNPDTGRAMKVNGRGHQLYLKKKAKEEADAKMIAASKKADAKRRVLLRHGLINSSDEDEEIPIVKSKKGKSKKPVVVDSDPESDLEVKITKKKTTVLDAMSLFKQTLAELEDGDPAASERFEKMFSKLLE